MTIDYLEKIPNNVNLSDDRGLRRALEAWQPRFHSWWMEMGPSALQHADIYLRTATSVDSSGWANFGHLKMPDYRWGIFLAKPEKDRKIGFGIHRGAPVWQDVPGEYRALLRRLIVTQGDTEPASVEQQRHLGATCPSLYDLRNLFQVNVEEARHLWAMVYLLHAYFGRNGRDEADALLMRRSGDMDKPRILGAFNEQTPEWLSFFMFTFFTDRDGKYQLATLAESGFDPLARTCRFMLTEEAHHMFVGETGVQRIVQRTCELMLEHNTESILDHGGIDLILIQKFINFHCSISLDLFGSELSTNAAGYYATGLKGRYGEQKITDDHCLEDATYPVERPVDNCISTAPESALNALNERLRIDYLNDCQRGIERWNQTIENAGINKNLTLPHHGFNRRIGAFRDFHVTPSGEPLTNSEWINQRNAWLPTKNEQASIANLMHPVTTPGQMASWISPPRRGINGKPTDYDYVRFT